MQGIICVTVQMSLTSFYLHIWLHQKHTLPLIPQAQAANCWICFSSEKSSLGSKGNPGKQTALRVWKLKTGMKTKKERLYCLLPKMLSTTPHLLRRVWKHTLIFQGSRWKHHPFSFIESLHKSSNTTSRALPTCHSFYIKPSVSPGGGGWRQPERRLEMSTIKIPQYILRSTRHNVLG